MPGFPLFATAAGNFTPATPSNLIMWLDSVNSTFDTNPGGDQLIQWNDNSPLGSHMANYDGANRPFVVSDAFGGGSVVGFSMVDAYLYPLLLPPSFTNGLTIVAVINAVADPEGEGTLELFAGPSEGPNAAWAFGVNASAERIEYWGGNFTAFSDFGSLSPGTHTIAVTHTKEGQYAMYIDGAEVKAGSGTWYDCSITKMGLEGFLYSPEIGLALAYDRGLSAGEIGQLHNFAQGTWF